MNAGEQIPEAEVVASSTEVVAATPAAMIFKTEDPMEIMQRTAEVATALKQFVKDQGLVSQISGRDYLLVEGWQMLQGTVERAASAALAGRYGSHWPVHGSWHWPGIGPCGHSRSRDLPRTD